MLEQVDLKLSMPKKQAKGLIEPLGYRLNELQRLCREAGIPIVLVFEGWDASGKGYLIGKLLRSLDPRGYKVYYLKEPNEDETLRPFLWRSWIRLPARGNMTIFDQSWYRRVLIERNAGSLPARAIESAFQEIIQFERQLVEDGLLLVKFWLHISRKEQKRRFEMMEKDPSEAWKVNPFEWEQNRNYQDCAGCVEDMLQKTSLAEAPWTIVEAEDKHFASLKIFETVARALEAALARKPPPATAARTIHRLASHTHQLESQTFMAQFDLTKKLSEAKYKEKLEKLQDKMLSLHHRLYLQRAGAVIVFEGWDAAGKGGAIRRLLEPLDPRGFEVLTTAAPTQEEKNHHYLWRFWRGVPKRGHLAVYDRSWYGRVLVERVEGFCSTAEWQRAYAEINEFEGSLISAGIVVIKFWLQIDRDEQLRRFKDREKTAYKKWKITPEDYRNRKKWDAYELAVAEMIQRTSTRYAPWTVVESNDKLYARINVIDSVAQALERTLKKQH